MSLQFIYQFQARIYELLSQEQTIRQKVVGIYLSVQHDAKYPFILVSMLKSKNLSKYDLSNYELDFEIGIFARDKTQEFLMQLASQINSVLKLSVLGSGNYNVISLRENGLEFIRGHDLLTNKVAISYSATLQGGIQ